MNKALKFDKNPSRLISFLNKLLHKGCVYNTVVKSLSMVFFGIDIDFLIASLNKN